MKLDLFVWHKSIGMVMLALIVVRMAWRLANVAPSSPSAAAAGSGRAARAATSFFTCAAPLPVTGWVVNSAANVPFRVFRRDPLAGDRPAGQGRARCRGARARGALRRAAVLLAVHVGAALCHHFGRHDNVLARMLRGTGRHPMIRQVCSSPCSRP